MSRVLPRAVLVVATFNAALYILSRHKGLDPREVMCAPEQAPLGGRAFWREAMRLRRYAIYLAVTMFDLPQADAARALGVSRANIGRLLEQVEDERDDPAIDAALDEIGFLTGGIA